MVSLSTGNGKHIISDVDNLIIKRRDQNEQSNKTHLRLGVGLEDLRC